MAGGGDLEWRWVGHVAWVDEIRRIPPDCLLFIFLKNAEESTRTLSLQRCLVKDSLQNNEGATCLPQLHGAGGSDPCMLVAPLAVSVYPCCLLCPLWIQLCPWQKRTKQRTLAWQEGSGVPEGKRKTPQWPVLTENQKEGFGAFISRSSPNLPPGSKTLYMLPKIIWGAET